MALTNAYITLAELKSALRIPASDTLDDGLLEKAINSASRLIDGYANRSFFNGGTATRIYAPQDSYVTQFDDLQSLTTLETSSDGTGFDTTWASTDYQLEPLNGISDGLTTPYTRVRAVGNIVFVPLSEEATVRITGVWGWDSTPDAISQACVIQASRIFKRLDSPLGVAGFGDMGVVRVTSRLDGDVAQLVEPYRKVSFA
jgi:hypothetical protein